MLIDTDGAAGPAAPRQAVLFDGLAPDDLSPLSLGAEAPDWLV